MVVRHSHLINGFFSSTPAMLSTPSLSTAAVWLAVLAFLIPLIQHAWNKSTETKRLPPGPKALPLIGNLHQLPKRRQFEEFHRWSKQYGPIMYLDMAGHPLIVLSSHQAARDLLSCRSSRYSDRPRRVMCGELVTKGLHMLLRPYDAAYKLHQRMEAPLLSVRAAKSYTPLQDLEARQLLFDLMKESDVVGEEGLDASHHFERAMASFIYGLAYGYRLKTGREESFEAAKRVQAEFARTGVVGAYIVDTLPVLNKLPAFLAPWKKEAEELYLLEENLHVGNMRRGLESLSWNFTKHYFNNCPEAKGMPEVEVAFDLGILADAALDTSTVTMEWFVVAWVTSGGRWVAKAQELLDDVVGRGRMPQFEDRDRLAYIEAIVNETLRWRPVVVAGVPHATKTEDTYMGHRIPAGSIVMGNHFAITRDESVFGDRPDDFIPERWLAEDGSLKDLPLTGFGFGRRICSGRNIARNGLFIHIAKLLWAFDIEVGISEVTGEREVVDDLAGSEGFVFIPTPFKTVFRPRSPWVRDLIEGQGSTHEIDHAELLDQAGNDRVIKLDKA